MNSIEDSVTGTLRKEGDLSLGVINQRIYIHQSISYIFHNRMDEEEGVQSERWGEGSFLHRKIPSGEEGPR